MDALIYSPAPSHPANAGNRQMIYHIGKYLQSVGYVVHYVYCTFEGQGDAETAANVADLRTQWPAAAC